MEKWQRLLTVLAALLLMLILTVSTVRLLMEISHTIVLFALGMLLAYALDPVVEWLRRTSIGKSGKRPSREMSVTVVVLGFLAVLAFGFWALEWRVVHEVGVLQHSMPYYRAVAMREAATLDERLREAHINISLTQAIRNPPPDLQDTERKAGYSLLQIVGHAFVGVGESIIVLLITIYLLIYSAEMRERFNRGFPPPIRERIEIWQTDMSRILGGFVRGQVLIALLVGGLAAIGCLALGIRIWLLIGLVVAIAALIPVFGPYLGVIPAVIAALIGPTHIHNPVIAAVVIAVYFTVINEIGSKVLYPKLVGAALGLHPVVVLFVIFAGLEAASVLGVLFAAPITALVSVTVIHLYRWWQDLPDSLVTPSAVEIDTERDARKAA